MVDEIPKPKAPAAPLSTTPGMELLATRLNERVEMAETHVVQLCSQAMADGSVATLTAATNAVQTIELRTVREMHAVRLRFMSEASRLPKPLDRAEALRRMHAIERRILVHLRWLRDRRFEMEVKRSEVVNKDPRIPSIVIRSGREVRVALRSIRPNDTKKD